MKKLSVLFLIAVFFAACNCAAVGMSSLPANKAVEIETVAELAD